MDPQLLTTYRYLRMALVTVLALLAFGVLVEIITSPEPLLTSISAYFWTPVRSVFVGTLVALGVGMIVIKADNELEDIFLNVAGVLAPVVAFVPTAEVGTCFATASGDPPPALPAATVDGIANNMTALLAAGALGLVIFMALVVRAPASRSTPLPTGVKVARIIGSGIVVALFVAAWIWFTTARSSFECHAHDVAAVCLFVCIVAVTILNGVTRFLEQRAEQGLLRAAANRYSALAVLMVLVMAVGILVMDSWDYAILFIEAGVLVLFLSFWVAQSSELWERGVRHRGAPPSLGPYADEPADR